MNDDRQLLDPTSEQSPDHRPRLERPDSLRGKTVGLMDISKARGQEFLDSIEPLLRQEGCEVRRYRKPTFARLAPVGLRQQMHQECDLLVVGLAD